MIFTIFIMAIILGKTFFTIIFHFVISFSSFFFTFESELFWSYSANTICWFLRQSFYESWNLLWNMYQYVWMCYVDTMFLCFLLHVFFRMYEWYLKKLKYATNFRDRVVCVKKKTLFVTYILNFKFHASFLKFKLEINFEIWWRQSDLFFFWSDTLRRQSYQLEFANLF